MSSVIKDLHVYVSFFLSFFLSLPSFIFSHVNTQITRFLLLMVTVELQYLLAFFFFFYLCLYTEVLAVRNEI